MVVTERGEFTCCSFRCVLISAVFSRGIQSSRRRVPLVKLKTTAWFIGIMKLTHRGRKPFWFSLVITSKWWDFDNNFVKDFVSQSLDLLKISFYFRNQRLVTFFFTKNSLWFWLEIISKYVILNICNFENFALIWNYLEMYNDEILKFLLKMLLQSYKFGDFKPNF